MSNGETLQEYNTNLAENNDVLDNILDMVNNLPSGGSSISSDTYSTEEIKTNKIWIDGKPIYRKVVVIDSIGNNLNYSIEYDCSYMDTVWINQSCSFMYAEHETLPLNWFYEPNYFARIWLNKNVGIRVRANGDLSTHTAYLTLEYTKKTDTGTEVN